MVTIRRSCVIQHIKHNYIFVSPFFLIFGFVVFLKAWGKHDCFLMNTLEEGQRVYFITDMYMLHRRKYAVDCSPGRCGWDYPIHNKSLRFTIPDGLFIISSQWQYTRRNPIKLCMKRFFTVVSVYIIKRFREIVFHRCEQSEMISAWVVMGYHWPSFLSDSQRWSISP